MFSRARGRALGLLVRAVVCFATVATCSGASADDDVKQSCLEAHGQGQDEKEQGHITLARGFFAACAQPTCPALVKDDCARLLDEVDRAQPSIGFSARDASGSDLPDSSVFIDGVLVISRLDGIWHDIDPGMHIVRFEHGGRRQEHDIIVAAGEKGRVIVGVFDDPQPAAPARTLRVRARRIGRALAIGASAALVGVGGTLLIVGLGRVPDKCSLAEHECAAPPGDAAFHEASRAVRLSNVGWAVAGVGLAALGASLIWYFKAAKATEHARRSHIVTPFASAHGAGIAVSGRL
jgi:hypothetical protein